MSTEHQQYSTENQMFAIVRYAQAHDMDIVRTYSDHGKSGLTLIGRSGLQQLLADVSSGDVDFVAVLVYDVSRWGRFQNPDQGASYEFSLTSSGVMVHYCAEEFRNDGSLSSALLKTVKRGMAGEYSRELSVKVWAGQRRLIELGYRQGGPAGYGLRRHLIDQNHQFKQVLGHGDRKSLQTDRVILVPGPEIEVSIVRQIYRRFLEERRSETEIAQWLNAEGVPWQFGRCWTRENIRQILTNPKYIGTNTYNRTSYKLHVKRINNPPEQWIQRHHAFEPVIDHDQFTQAQQIILSRNSHLSNDEILIRLKRLLNAKGYLTGLLIEECDELPTCSTIARRFGCLIRAYKLIGWTPLRDLEYVEINRHLRRRYGELVSTISEQLRANGASLSVDPDTDLLTINDEYSVSVVVVRCKSLASGARRWLVRFDSLLRPDITIAARLTPENDAIFDYYILPRVFEFGDRIHLRDDNPLTLDVYRFETLDYFIEIARRTQIEAIA